MKKNMIGIIYKYTSPSGKFYIGQTTTPKNRYKQHKNEAYNNKYSIYNSAFCKAIRKYGYENFEYETIVTLDYDDINKLTEKLDWFEKYYIKKYKSLRENGYNLTEGGGGLRGYKMSEREIELLRQRYPNSALAKFSHKKGDKLPEEVKLKISNTLKGRPKSDEHKKKVAQANSKYKKAIVCIENDKTYASVHDAARELNLQFGNIWSVCNGKRKTTGGYHFIYK